MKRILITSLISLSLAAFGGSAYCAIPIESDSYDDMDMAGYIFSDDSEEDAPTLIKEKKEKFVSDEENVDVQDGFLNGDETLHSVFYNSIMTQDPRTMQMGNIPRNNVYDPKKLPVFKRTRIKFSNMLRNQEYKTYQKELAKEQAQLEEYEKALKKEQEDNDIFYTSKEQKENAKKAKEVVVEDVQIEDPDAPVPEAKKAVKLKGKLKQNKGENVVVLDAKNVYYIEEDDEIIAENDAIVKFPKQKIVMRAEKFVYSNSSNIIKAIGNVKITHSGKDIFCDYVQVNVNEEEISFDNFKADFPTASINAESGCSKGNSIYLYNGYLSSETGKRVGLPSRKIKNIQPDSLLVVEEEDMAFLQPYIMKEDKIHLDTDRIIINAKRDHDVITFKDTKVRYGNKKFLRIPSLTMYMDKQHSSFEGNYPEFGSIARLGMYVGPGVVFEVPRAGTLKFIPFLNYKRGNVGFGGALRYHSTYNTTELGYGSVQDLWVLKGYQQLDDKLALRYGMNTFLDQWYFGPRMAKYALELAYGDNYTIPNSIKEGLNMNYEHRATFGYYHNSMFNMNYERFQSGNIGTFRLRYMAQLQQELLKYKNEKHKFDFTFSGILQGSAALYGTGDTQMVGRAGFGVQTQYKYWKQNINYFLSAWEDQTPMQRFDAYRYGRSSVTALEAIRVCKYLSLAWLGVVTLSDDAPNGKLFQENAFLFIIGPDDMKFTLGYDFVRKRTYFTFGFSLNTTGATLNYKTLEIKNPDKFSGNSGEELVELQPEFWMIPQQKVKAQPLQYATVINLKDKENKERID